ncbi:SusC/RagA family TonB-linked outer membrane protein [Chitinophaga cymbidii]|uniref:SusC/RagA family TonB-linked outer membrane protein n=1 Tax=Chitinophaga cymbidii TaxID=1096750 RepID=A0A512RQR6_9BACT|nr:TonB-dependent receptor [Chitinophaga cymbidii]GEP98043.1 SusC/RagA family TonB-linked outer membrane protein [Chitinophaga cymbidii]
MKLKLMFHVMLLLFASLSFAQTKVVTGTVQDEKGAPVPGATVIAKGTSTGTTTSPDGRFSLTVPPSVQILVISNIGFTSQEMAITDNTPLRVILTESARTLGDFVVIGYGTVRKKELTGAVSTVTAKDFQRGTITTPEQLIAGKIAGVAVTSNSGAPGAGSTIRIRGGASLNASNDPLIVIDGLPVNNTNIYGASNPLSLVNPNDIESFTVLKDAASTAIYGSRASNGVIIITTKKGTRGKPQFNFSSLVSLSQIARQADVMSAAEFRRYVDSLGTPTFKSLLGATETDWQKEIYTTAITTDNNLSIAGFWKNIPYRLSGGYLNQDGILKTDNLKRVSAGISFSPSLLNDHLKIDVNLKGAVNRSRFANNAAISSAVYFDPTQPVHANTPFGGYWEWYTTDPGNGGITLNKLAPRNPVALLDLYRNIGHVQRSYGNVQFDYKLPFLPELHANLNLGYDVAKGEGTIDVPAYAGQNYLDSGQHNQYGNKVRNLVSEFYLNYNKTFPAIKSNINATAGYGYYDNLATNYNYPFVRANGNIAPGSEPKFPMDKPQSTLTSYYGRLIYTFDSKYILAASVRTDGSSRFSPGTRWGTFPSVALTWLANREKWLAGPEQLSDLKLRLSYGITGNQDGIYNYPYLPVYALGDNSSMVQFGDEYYNMGSPAAYDAGIKWEQTATWNAGIDYGFWNNRINGSVDLYFKKTKDLLNTIPVPAGSNFSSTILTNVGNIENKGIELLINLNPVKSPRFSWDLSFNAAYNHNRITNLTATKDSTYAGSMVGTIQIHSVGYRPFSFYTYHQQYDQNGKPIEGVYVDVNGDGIINTEDLYRYQSPAPKWILGFSTQFTYDRWALGTVLRGSIGNYMYNALATGATQSNIFNTLGYLANSLTEVNNSAFYYGQQYSDYYVQNASFLKMDNLSLSYDFGRIIKQKLGLRVNAVCQNVFTITKYTGIDPEINGGVDNALYPRPRIYSLGVNLQY